MRASLMRWHRRVGLAAALLVLVATVTGILINHSDSLGLARQQVGSDWLLRWWGVKSPRLQFACARLQGGAEHWLSQWGERLVLDDQPLHTPDVEGLVGCLSAADAWLLVDRKQLMVLQPDGALIDQLAYPQGFVAARAGNAAGKVLVIEDAQGARLQADASVSTIHPLTDGAATVQWAPTQTLPASLQERIQALPSNAGLSVERVLLDVHSGRWLGSGGVWLMDAAAIASVLLAATGTWTVLNRLRATRRRTDASLEESP